MNCITADGEIIYDNDAILLTFSKNKELLGVIVVGKAELNKIFRKRNKMTDTQYVKVIGKQHAAYEGNILHDHQPLLQVILYLHMFFSSLQG